MAAVEIQDLAMLALAGGKLDTSEPPSLSVVELSDYLEMGADTFSDRIALMSTLSDLEAAGLVESNSREDSTVYSLTDDGVEYAADLFEDVLDRQIEVRNGTSELVSLAQVDQYLPDPAVVRALARLVDGQTLYLEEGVDEEFVDRSDELAQLDDHREAAAAGTGRAVFVTGPSGVGKTALVQEFLDRSPDWQALTGVCRPETNEPYQGLRDALAEAPGETVDASIVRQQGEQPDDHREFEKRRRELFASVANGLLDRAEQNPVVLSLDDFQHAGEPTVECLQFLADRASEGRLLIVVAAPLESLPDPTPVDGMVDSIEESDPHERLRLGPFDRDSTRELIEGILGTRRVPGEFVEGMYEHTGGNALFVTELLAELVEADKVVPEHDIYPEDPTAVATSERIQETIDSRLDGLGEDGLTVLYTASLLGGAFDASVLEVACPVGDDRLREYLDVLQDANVLTRQDDRGEKLRFANGLFHETVVERIPDDRREELHGMIADALASVGGMEPALAAEMAYHREQAGDQRALDAWIEAGDFAGTVYANEVALESYERALDLARESNEDRIVEIVESTGDVSELVGDYERAIRAYEFMLSEANSEAVRARAHRKRATVIRATGELDTALETIEAALELASEESLEYCFGLRELGWVHCNRGDLEAGESALEECLSLANDLGEYELQVDAWLILGRTAGQHGQFDRALESFERCVEICREHDYLPGEGRAVNGLGIVSLHSGDLAAAEKYYERGLEISQDVGHRHLEAECNNNLGLVTMQQGEYDRAREYFERSLELDREIAARGSEAMTLINLGTINRKQGRFARARDVLERALDMHRESGQRNAAAFTLRNLGVLAKNEGEFEAARDHFEESLAIHRDLGEEVYEAYSLACLGELAVETGDVEGARSHADEATRLVADGDHPDVMAIIHRTRAKLALEGDEYERARELGDDALAAFNDAYDRAQTRELIGRSWAGEGNTDRAIEEFESAIEGFESLHATHAGLETIRKLLDSLDGTADPDEITRWAERARDLLTDAPEEAAKRHREWVEQLS